MPKRCPQRQRDRLAADTAPGVITNVAYVHGTAPDPLHANNTAFDPVPVDALTNLVLTKSTTGANPVQAGEGTAFTVAVANEGPSDARDVTVVDTLPAGVVLVSAGGPGWTCAPSGQQVTCVRPALAAGATAPLDVTAEVESGVPDGAILTNTATVTTSTPQTSTLDDTDSATVTVVAAADVSIAKSHAPAYDDVPAGSQAGRTSGGWKSIRARFCGRYRGSSMDQAPL